jgi:hypothetical protein
MNDKIRKLLSRPGLLVPLAAIPFIALVLFILLQFSNDQTKLSVENISSTATIPLTINTKAGEVKFQVETALNATEWENGLMYRQTMAPDHGMIFIFPQSSKRSFWMKNTYIPLDIIFLDTNKRIINISQNATPLRQDIIYDSKSPSMYVLEVNAGISTNLGLESGDQANF